MHLSRTTIFDTHSIRDIHRFFFFFNDTATTEIYTLSLHDALPICIGVIVLTGRLGYLGHVTTSPNEERSEEHTSELQSRLHLVCRLLLEKKKKNLVELSPSYEVLGSLDASEVME